MNSHTTIVVDIHRDLILTSNQRIHWAQKAWRVKALREFAAAAWRKAGSPQMSRAHCTIHVTYPCGRHVRDLDNLRPTIKALIDGAVHPAVGVRGLLADDSDTYLVGPDLRADTATPRHPHRYTFRLDLVDTAAEEVAS